jgi:hypothetical protein
MKKHKHLKISPKLGEKDSCQYSPKNLTWQIKKWSLQNKHNNSTKTSLRISFRMFCDLKKTFAMWETSCQYWQSISHGKIPKCHGKTNFAMANANFKCIFIRKLLNKTY